MLTELLVPDKFANSFWFNLVVFQLYIGAFVGVLVFARDALFDLMRNIMVSLLDLILAAFAAIFNVVTDIVTFPVRVFEYVVFQYIPIKKRRVDLIEVIQSETEDIELFEMIKNKREKVLNATDIRKLEDAVIFYHKCKQNMMEHAETTEENEEAIEVEETSNIEYIETCATRI